MKAKLHVLLLTGTPGIGKSTVIRQIAEQLRAKQLAGFYTQEIRINGVRKGFELICFDGRKYVFSHVDFAKQYRVSKYGVDIAVLDKIVEDILLPQDKIDIFLVDEIGKMECFSEKFIHAMRKLLNSDKKIIATVALHGEGFIEEVKRRRDVSLWHITRENRNLMPQTALQWLKE